MKLIAALSILAFAALPACTKVPSAPFGQTQTTSGVICPTGAEPTAEGRCLETAPPREFEVP